MSGIAKQIIGSFEDIAENVARETVSVPKDIAGKALESLGATSGQKGQAQANSTNATDSRNLNEKGPLGQIDKTSDVKTKQAIARAALEQLSGRSRQKEPTVWERQQQEEEQKKEMQKKQAELNARSQLPKISGKRKAGDLYGVNAKKAAAEKKSGKDT